MRLSLFVVGRVYSPFGKNAGHVFIWVNFFL